MLMSDGDADDWKMTVCSVLVLFIDDDNMWYFPTAAATDDDDDDDGGGGGGGDDLCYFSQQRPTDVVDYRSSDSTSPLIRTIRYDTIWLIAIQNPLLSPTRLC